MGQTGAQFSLPTPGKQPAIKLHLPHAGRPEGLELKGTSNPKGSLLTGVLHQQRTRTPTKTAHLSTSSITQNPLLCPRGGPLPLETNGTTLNQWRTCDFITATPSCLVSICWAEERPEHCPLCVKELQEHGWNRTRGRTRARSHLSVLLKNNYLHFEIDDASIKKESRWKFFPSISPTAGWFDLLTFNFSLQLLMISSQVSHYLQKKLFFFLHICRLI